MITHKNAEIQQAKDLLYTLSMDKYAREIYEARQKAQMDIRSGIAKAKRDGLLEGEIKGHKLGKEEGINIGKKELALDIAKKLILTGISKPETASITGLTEEEIE